jgi:formylglycine-generating enzyme
LVDALEYVYVPAGAFEMGCAADDADCEEDEKPSRRVEQSHGFWMGRTEVTVRAFRTFVSARRYRTTAESDGWSRSFDGKTLAQQEGVTWQDPGFAQGPKHPVLHVSWYDARQFCAWAGGRLPSETEWEYAARGGQASAKYLWGRERLPLVGGVRQANVADESLKRRHPSLRILSGYDDGYVYSAPGGAFAPNGFGLYDMTGNAAEWCSDWYAKEGTRASPGTEPVRPPLGLQRSIRGGSWIDEASNLRASYRVRDIPAYHDGLVGFRCVRDVSP